MRIELGACVYRGQVLESRHELEAALAGPDGELLASTGSPALVTMIRSAAKPFQLLPLVERGHADRWGFSDEQLAVMAGSHTGSPYHLGLVRGILERIGVGPEALVCGYHDPEDPESLASLRGGGAGPSPLYNNCSGKHAGLLTLARAEGWPVEGYHLPDHPVQQLLLRTIAEISGIAPGSIPTAVDGCSLVVYALPLQAMARGYATLAAASRSGGTDARSAAMARIVGAMTAYPRAVEGRGRLSTALMEATKGRLLAKCGAEGLQLVALLDRGQGLAVKCVDGAQRATGPAVVAVLEQLGVLSEEEIEALANERRMPLRNAAGLDVGHVIADLRVGANTGSPHSSARRFPS
jgi:L-asparaginase II